MNAGWRFPWIKPQHCQRAVLSLLGLWLILTPGVGAQPAPSIWIGSGQILSGQGQGATVDLVIETWPGRIRTQSGPSLDAPFAEPTTTIRNGESIWQIERQGDQMLVTVYRGNQIIRYQLQAANNARIARPATGSKLPYSQPMATFAPVMQQLIPVEPLPFAPKP